MGTNIRGTKCAGEEGAPKTLLAGFVGWETWGVLIDRSLDLSLRSETQHAEYIQTEIIVNDAAEA